MQIIKFEGQSVAFEPLPSTQNVGVMHYGEFESPFGHVFMAVSRWGICDLRFGTLDFAEVLKELGSKWEADAWTAEQAGIKKLGAGLFVKPTAALKQQVLLRGTAFQLEVWKALLAVPFGCLKTYSDIALAAGHPKAQRAVGTAIGNNPVAFLVPCHRVIRKDGTFGNYRWGADRKRALIEWEKEKARC